MQGKGSAKEKQKSSDYSSIKARLGGEAPQHSTDFRSRLKGWGFCEPNDARNVWSHKYDA